MDRDIPTIAFASGQRTPDAAPSEPSLPSAPLDWWLHYNLAPTIALASSGNVLNMTKSAPQISMFTEGNPNLSADLVNSYDVITGATNPANNGTFLVVSHLGPAGNIHNNAAGVAESASPAQYRFPGVVHELYDVTVGARFAAFNNGTRLAIQDTYEPPHKLFADPCTPASHSLISTTRGAPFTGNVSASFAVRFCFPFGWSAGNLCFVCMADPLGHTMNCSFPNSTTMMIHRENAEGSTDYKLTIPALSVGTWYTAGWGYDSGAARLRGYIDGLPVGTAPTTGTARSLTSLTVAGLGSGKNVTGGTGTTPTFFKMFAGHHSLWTPAQFLEVHQSFLAYDAYWGP